MERTSKPSASALASRRGSAPSLSSIHVENKSRAVDLYPLAHAPISPALKSALSHSYAPPASPTISRSPSTVGTSPKRLQYVCPPTPILRGYNASNWGLLAIVKVDFNLTVTVLHHRSQTLFAWPFNLDPDGTSDSGKVFITPRSPDAADAPQPHLISESLKLVGVVLGNWMQNRSRFDVQTRIASTAPEGSTSPSRDEDGEVARIRRDLGLIRLTCEERAAALARQEIPSSAWRRPSCCSCAEAPDSPRRVAFDESPRSRPRESALGLRFDDEEPLELVNSRRHSIEPHRLRKSVSFDEKRNTTLTFETLPMDKATPLMRVKDALSFPSTAPFFKRDISDLGETSTDDSRRSVPASPASPSSVSPSLSEFSWSPKHSRSSLASPISSIGSCSEQSSSSGNFAVSSMSPLARPQSPTHIDDGHDLLTFSRASRRLPTEDVDLCLVATLPYKASSTNRVENASTAVLSPALLHSAELARCKEISTSLAASPMPISPTRGRTLQARASSIERISATESHHQPCLTCVIAPFTTSAFVILFLLVLRHQKHPTRHA
ncbi:hypothetical protein CBOM_02324 [Ceraceosorus bombacis]|uniref:Uncharacterized protein n=1 Tax=Ceraceosorus bombacis TaxID=401625 RepID=A0A0P1BEC8_9BASI|nr:hypothetical protein CBOM_02324 [Ceraceosorus bombacis]